MPFGEEIGANIGSRLTVVGYGGTDSTKQKFTEKERDTESGLDYFGARYYASASGRFTSADSYAGSANVPQTFSLYAYALNNPLKYVDPTGHFIVEKSPFDWMAMESAESGQNPNDGHVVDRLLAQLQNQTQRLTWFSEMAESILKSGRTAVVSVATQWALETIFGQTISFTPTGLSGPEVEVAKVVAVFEGRGFLGTPHKFQPGIDGFLHDGVLPTSNPQAVQLQENSTGGEPRILTDAVRHENSARDSGFHDVDLYVRSNDKNVTVRSVLRFAIDGGANRGFQGITGRGIFKTIFTQDGVIRIRPDKLSAIVK